MHCWRDVIPASAGGSPPIPARASPEADLPSSSDRRRPIPSSLSASASSVDLPSDLRRQLLRSASEAVRTRLLSRAPPHLFEEIQSAIAAVTVGVEREMSGVRDFEGAKRAVAGLRATGQLSEATLLGFATQRRYEEAVAALAALSGSTVEVIRPLMQSLREDGLLVPCKAAQLSWETTAAVLESRFASGAMKPADIARAQSHYARMTPENARRTLRFWQVRAL
ncbi:hypothetical protein ACVWZ6_000720 [Bradyrhizobium sp. GM6.1]